MSGQTDAMADSTLNFRRGATAKTAEALVGSGRIEDRFA